MSVLTRRDVLDWIERQPDMASETITHEEIAEWVNEAADVALAHGKEVARLNAEARRMTALHPQRVEELDATRTAAAGWEHAGRTQDEMRRELEAQNTELREIVRAVGGVSDVHYSHVCDECPFCGDYVPMRHKPECPVTQARALLARADEGEEGSAES